MRARTEMELSAQPTTSTPEAHRSARTAEGPPVSVACIPGAGAGGGRRPGEKEARQQAPAGYGENRSATPVQGARRWSLVRT